MFAGARKGQMPTMFALINSQHDSPRVAVLAHVRPPGENVQTILSIAFSFLGDVEDLIDYLGVVNLLITAASIVALLYIRYKDIPVHPDTIRV